MVSIVIGFPFSDKHASLSGASWPLAPGNPSILPFLLSIQRFLPSLTGSTPGSERLSLIRSGEVLQQPRCALRGHFIDLATKRGHSIRAVYRTIPHVSPSGQVEILVNPDIFNPDFVTQAIHGADVVITTLGPNFARHHNALTTMISPPDLHQRLARTLVRVTRDSGASPKVISVSTGSM